MSMPPRESAPIVFFDGVCGLCNRLVDRLLRWDRRGVLRFAPLQGETARRMLSPQLLGSAPLDSNNRAPDTLVLVDARGEAHRSEAVLRALGHLGGAWKLMSLLRVVPRPVRDGVYRFIAARRYRWFGKSDTCRIPAPAERARFLA